MATAWFPTLNLSAYGHPLFLFGVEEEGNSPMEKAQHRGPHGHLLTQPRAHHQHAPLVPSHLMESHLSHTHCHLPAVASSQPSTCWEKMHMCVCGASAGETSCPLT